MTHLISRKSPSDKEEIKRLRKILVEKDSTILELKKQLATLPQVRVDDLTQREKMVLSHLRENPGVSKEWLIKKIDAESMGSRVTIVNAINNLIKFGIISASKDKLNSQIYRLYLNENSVFLKVYLELDKLKEAFFKLIEKLKDSNNVKAISDHCYYDMFFIYQHVFNVYTTYSVLKWPNEIEDKLILNKIYAIVFYRMIEIQNKMYEVFNLQNGMPDLTEATAGQVCNPILRDSIFNAFLLRPEYIVRIIKRLKSYNINNNNTNKKRKAIPNRDMISLLDIVWKIGFSMYLYTDLDIVRHFILEDIDKLKNFKYAVRYQLTKNHIPVDKEVTDIIGVLRSYSN
jgi:predicted transcriptional regulator